MKTVEWNLKITLDKIHSQASLVRSSESSLCVISLSPDSVSFARFSPCRDISPSVYRSHCSSQQTSSRDYQNDTCVVVLSAHYTPVCAGVVTDRDALYPNSVTRHCPAASTTFFPHQSLYSAESLMFSLFIVPFSKKSISTYCIELNNITLQK